MKVDILRSVRNVSCIAMAGFVLAATGPAWAENTTLSIISQSDPKPYTAIIEAFQKENPDISIKLQTPGQTYEEILQRSIRSAMIGDVPDVVFQGYNVIGAAVDKELPVELSPFLGAEKNLKELGYDTNQFDACSIGGQIYGLPFATSLPIFYVNGDLARKAGGDPDNLPTTWEDLVELATRINALGGQTSGIYFRYTHSGNWSFQALITSQGGRMMAPDETALAFNGKEGLFALQLLHSFTDAGMVDMTADQARQAFAAGTIGILADSSSSLKSVTDQVAGSFDLRTAAYPFDEEAGKFPPGGSCIMMLSKDKDRQAAAWRFIKFATGMQGQTILANNSGYVPNNRLAIENPNLLGKFYQENPNYLVVARLVPRLTQFFEFPGENNVKIGDVIQDHLQTVVARKATPEEALNAMARDVTALLPAN